MKNKWRQQWCNAATCPTHCWTNTLTGLVYKASTCLVHDIKPIQTGRPGIESARGGLWRCAVVMAIDWFIELSASQSSLVYTLGLHTHQPVSVCLVGSNSSSTSWDAAATTSRKLFTIDNSLKQQSFTHTQWHEMGRCRNS